MRSRAELDAELDAAHARTAAQVDELEKPGPGLAAGLYALRAATMDVHTALRVAALWTRHGCWVDAESMVPVATALNEAETLPGAQILGAFKLVAEELAALTARLPRELLADA